MTMYVDTIVIAAARATSQTATLLTAARTGTTKGALIGINEAIRAGQASGDSVA
jgi:hypothetical protein